MKTVKEIIDALEKEGVKIGKTQVIMDIRLGRLGIKAQKIGNIYVIEDSVARAYIRNRIKISK